MASPRRSAAALGAAALAIGLGACGGGGARSPAAPPASGPAQYVDLFVPEPARGELGLSGGALDATPFLDPSETPGLVERLRALAQPARACLEPPGSAWVTFRIWGDGHASVERVATLAVAAPAVAAVRRCVEAVVSGWAFPEPPGGRGIVLLQIFPGGPPPAHAVFQLDPEVDATELTEPAPVQPGCVAAAMRKSRAAAELAREGANTVAMFTVNRSGTASGFHVLEPTPVPLAAAVRAAVVTCRWRPSVSDGRTVAVWVIQPFRFAPE